MERDRIRHDVSSLARNGDLGKFVVRTIGGERIPVFRQVRQTLVSEKGRSRIVNITVIRFPNDEVKNAHLNRDQGSESAQQSITATINQGETVYEPHA